MKYKLIVIFYLIISSNLKAQVNDTLNQDVSPMNGINQLAIKYYGIDFTKEQRKEIENVEIEFIYLIDEFGNPTLSEINGITNKEILDSLQNKTNEIGTFKPQKRNGVAVQSIYFMKLTFPKYKFSRKSISLLQGIAYNEAKLEDFEYINKSGSRIDLTAGVIMNQFFGKPSDYLSFGSGMKFELSFTDKKSLIYGLNMNFYGNKLKKDYPITSIREQNSSIPTLLVGMIFGKWFKVYNVQAEINLGVQNITEKLGGNDLEWVQLKGWSTGMVANLPVNLRKPRPMYYYGSPILFENNLNLNFGLRYVNFSLKEASGFMTELGVSYKFVGKRIKEYKLKEEYRHKYQN